jgi:hypothetical protein
MSVVKSRLPVLPAEQIPFSDDEIFDLFVRLCSRNPLLIDVQVVPSADTKSFALPSLPVLAATDADARVMLDFLIDTRPDACSCIHESASAAAAEEDDFASLLGAPAAAPVATTTRELPPLPLFLHKGHLAVVFWAVVPLLRVSQPLLTRVCTLTKARSSAQPPMQSGLAAAEVVVAESALDAAAALSSMCVLLGSQDCVPAWRTRMRLVRSGYLRAHSRPLCAIPAGVPAPPVSTPASALTWPQLRRLLPEAGTSPTPDMSCGDASAAAAALERLAEPPRGIGNGELAFCDVAAALSTAAVGAVLFGDVAGSDTVTDVTMRLTATVAASDTDAGDEAANKARPRLRRIGGARAKCAELWSYRRWLIEHPQPSQAPVQGNAARLTLADPAPVAAWNSWVTCDSSGAGNARIARGPSVSAFGELARAYAAADTHRGNYYAWLHAQRALTVTVAPQCTAAGTATATGLPAGVGMSVATAAVIAVAAARARPWDHAAAHTAAAALAAAVAAAVGAAVAAAAAATAADTEADAAVDGAAATSALTPLTAELRRTRAALTPALSHADASARVAEAPQGDRTPAAVVGCAAAHEAMWLYRRLLLQVAVTTAAARPALTHALAQEFEQLEQEITPGSDVTCAELSALEPAELRACPHPAADFAATASTSAESALRSTLASAERRWLRAVWQQLRAAESAGSLQLAVEKKPFSRVSPTVLAQRHWVWVGIALQSSA